MNGICFLVHHANFSEGGFAKLVPIPTPHFFFFFFFVVFFYFFFFFGRVRGLLHVFFFYVTGVVVRGRRNAMVALNDFISFTLVLSTKSIFYIRDIRLHFIIIMVYRNF